MSVAYQSWEVGTVPKVYQCVMDAAPYRWQQQHESGKPIASTLSMYIHSSDESSDSAKSCAAQAAATVSPVSHSALRHGECGPVSPFVLPCSAVPGSERVPLVGDSVDSGNLAASKRAVGWNSIAQRGLRHGFGPLKVHPHEHEFDSLDQATPVGLSTDCLIVSTTTPPSPFQDCLRPSLSSSSSSIGAGGAHSLSSSESGSQDNSGDQEVQSALRAPLNLSSLEGSLPIRRGLSRHFAGQSKSFGCLADALTTSLAKPANPYAKKRKGLSIYDDRHRSFPPLSRTSASGISKKNSFGNRSNLALAVAMEAAQGEEQENDDDDEEDNDHPTPLPRMGLGGQNNNAAPSRSYSLSDLQGATPPTTAFSFSDLHGAARH